MAKKDKQLTYQELRALKLNLRQELFCQNFVLNNELYGNGTLCYAEAYDYKLDGLSKERETRMVKKNGVEIEETIIGSSEYDKSINVCSVEASNLLRKPSIQERINTLFRGLLNDDFVDGELARLVKQNEEPNVKLGSIKEYNKLKKRITDLVEVKRPLEDMSDEELAAVQRDARAQLSKK